MPFSGRHKRTGERRIDEERRFYRPWHQRKAGGQGGGSISEGTVELCAKGRFGHSQCGEGADQKRCFRERQTAGEPESVQWRPIQCLLWGRGA